MAPHSTVFAWRIPGTGEPSGLLSMVLHRAGHECSELAAAAAAVILIFWDQVGLVCGQQVALSPQFCHFTITSCLLLPGKSHGRRSPVGCSPWGP